MKNILLFFFSTMSCYSQCPCVQSAVIGVNEGASISHNNIVVAMDDIVITLGETVALYAKKSSGELIWYSKGRRIDENIVKPYETTEYTVQSVLESCPDAYDNVVVYVEEFPTTKSVYVFPNPTSDQLSIVTADNSIREVRLYDLNGRQLRYYDFVELAQQHIMDLTFLNTGIYLIKIVWIGGDEVVKKIIKN